MSNESVNGVRRDEGVGRIVGGQGQPAAGGGIPVEQQLQELSTRMDRMTTLMEQLMREHQPVANPQIPPHAIVNNEARRRAYREGRGDNFVEENEFRPPRGLEYVKTQMPQFAGKSTVDDYLEWESKVEGLFECYELNDNTRVRLAAVEFTGYAALWWKNIVDTRRMDGEAEIRTWQEMKRILRKRFVPANYKHELFMRLQTLRQGGKTVDEYIQEFEMLMIRSGAIESPE